MPESSGLRALLVGIDRYPSPTESSTERYPSLYGAVTDVQRVRRYLVETLGVSAERIEVLLAPHGENTDRLATSAELVGALLGLEAECRPGDHVLVFYSGHGGRAPTRIPEIKGADGLDEVLAPMDIADPATAYIRDVEIAAYLARMAARGVFVVLALDCCHSGGVPRNRRRFRGVDGVDRTERPLSGLAKGRDELLQVWRPQGVEESRQERRSLSLIPSAARTPRGWALLAACRPHERALEDSIHGGEPSGLLTHFLLEALQGGQPGLTYRRLHSDVCARLHAYYPAQTPVVDGEVDRLVFGRDALPVPRGVEVIAVEGFPGFGLELAAGRLHGVRRGARYAVAPPPVGAAQPTAVAEAEVVEVGQSRSRASVSMSAGASRRPKPGDRALLIDPGPLMTPRAVAWAIPREADRFERLLRESGNGLLMAAASGQPSDFEVVLSEGGLEIRDRSGVPIPHLGPPLPPSDPATPAEILRRLVHLARYWNLRSLANPVETAPLRDALRLDLVREGESQGELGSEAVPEGTRVRLTVVNRSAEPLNLAVLDLQPDWGITQLFPATGPFETVEPGVPLQLDLDAHLPDGCHEGTDVLKVFAASEPFDLSSQEAPPVRASSTPAPPRTRLASRGGPFAELLASLAGERSRPMRCSDSAPDRWTTALVELRVVRTMEPGLIRGDHPVTAARGDRRIVPGRCTSRGEPEMEQRRGRTASLGSLLTGVGMLGVAAGTVVLIAYDFHRALQTWILETIEYSQRLAAMPGAIADVEIQVMALLALGGGIALLFAGLAVRAHAKAQLASERRTPAGAGAESPRVA